MNAKSFRTTMLAGSMLAIGAVTMPPAAAAQTASGHGSGYGGGYDSGVTAAPPGTQPDMPVVNPYSGTSPYSSANPYRSGSAESGAPHYGSTTPTRLFPSGPSLSDPSSPRLSAGTLMPGETAPPEAVRDPKLWEQWQKHGQYEYDRGYEAGRRDAVTYLRSNMQEDRAPYPPPTATPTATPTRMSDRYDGPVSAHAPTANEPWWSSNWDRMATDWPRLRDEIRRRWPQLTGYDIDSIQGQRAVLLTVIQDRYHLSNERAHDQVVAWQQTQRRG